MDGDGSFDPAELGPLLRGGRARATPTWPLGRRRPVGRGVWPWHARLGNAARGRLAAPYAPASRRTTSRRCGSAAGRPARARRTGPALRLPARAAAQGDRAPAGGSPSTTWPTARGPPGTRSKVSGSVRGTVRTARDFCEGAGRHEGAGRGQGARRRAREDPPRRRDRHGRGGPGRRRGAARHPGCLPQRPSTSATSRSTATCAAPRGGRAPRPAWRAGSCTRSAATTFGERLAHAHADVGAVRARRSRSGWTRRSSPPADLARGRRGLGDGERRAGPGTRTGAGGSWPAGPGRGRRPGRRADVDARTPTPTRGTRSTSAGHTVRARPDAARRRHRRGRRRGRRELARRPLRGAPGGRCRR